MRIAVTYENGQIFQHFGHTQMFKIYEVENDKIVSGQIVPTMGNGHGALAQCLSDMNVGTLICGGIGGGAKTALEQAGIKLFGGAFGSADKAIEDFVGGKLVYNPDVKCNHHDHGESVHTCGSNGCSGHSCK